MAIQNFKLEFKGTIPAQDNKPAPDPVVEKDKKKPVKD